MKNTQTPDFTNLNKAFQKNIEAVTSATQTASESVHALFRRSAEIAQCQMTASFDAIKDITSATNPEQAVARQQEFVKSTIEDGLSNTREMVDLTSKAAMEVLASIGNRVSDTINESMTAIKK